MIRWTGGSTLPTVLLTILMMPSARAQDAIPPAPARLAQHGGQTWAVPAPMTNAGPAIAPVQQPGYVHLGAPLYPSPQPNTPIWTGSTFITSQALAPHEMLYPHTYRALYPPYYHRVKGSYHWTPFGIKSHEKWELQGTMVQVKYRSRPPLFNTYIPPKISTMGPPWD